MTNKGQIIYSLLPRAEGLLLGTIGGMEVENFNREGAVKTLTDAIALLHKVRLLLEQELNNEPQPQTSVRGSVCQHGWVSSVAYKGARYCSKCGAYK